VELKGNNFFLRAYATLEDSGDSYNATGLGQLINDTWVQDLNGNIVPASQADNMWYTRYTDAYLGMIPGVAAGSNAAARSFADQGRYLPGTPEFEAQKDRLIGVQGLQGAGVLSQSKLFHVEGQYDFTNIIPVVDVVAGGNFRRFDMFTDGTLFNDKGGHIVIDEFGAFVQASKQVVSGLTLSSSLRYDKNQNFQGHYTPRASAVYTLTPNQALRLSYQTGFRNPTPVDQYINLNAGPITILGGVPDNSKGTNVYQNSFNTSSLGPFFGAFGQAVASGESPQAAVNQVKDLLVKSNVAYIKPEQVESWEIGYRGEFGGKLIIDASYYLNRYNDFLLNTVVIDPQDPVLGADGKVNPQAAFDLLNGASHLYQLYTNSPDQVQSQGVSAGVTWLLPKGYKLGGNFTWSEFDLQGANPNNIPAFNTPKWHTAVTFGNRAVTKDLGFNVAWRWQTAFDWTGTFNQLHPGRINTYSIIDAQVSYQLHGLKSVLKVGGTNILNNRVYQAYGSPSIGAVYYVSMTFDQLFD
jgi:outer membrane receptor protein involved in Fe transport